MRCIVERVNGVYYFAAMLRFRHKFLIGGLILIVMGCLVKFDGYANYNYSLIAGVANIAVYIVLHFRDEKLRQRDGDYVKR